MYLRHVDLERNVRLDHVLFIKIFIHRAKRRKLALLGPIATRVFFAVRSVIGQAVQISLDIKCFQLFDIFQCDRVHCLALIFVFYEIVQKHAYVQGIIQPCEYGRTRGDTYNELSDKFGQVCKYGV